MFANVWWNVKLRWRYLSIYICLASRELPFAKSKQSDKVKVKVTKSRINFSSDIAASQLACTYIFGPNCFSPSKSVLLCLSLQILKWQICTLPTVLQMVTHVRQGVFIQKDISNAIYNVVKTICEYSSLSWRKEFFRKEYC